MKRLIVLTFLLLLMSLSMVTASEDLGITASSSSGTIQYINPMTHEVSEPLLRNELGSFHTGLLDVAITPDGNKAIVSNFSDARIFIIDISGGFNGTPTVLGSIYTTIYAEDIAITPDGKYAIVTDGGFCSQVGVFDIANQGLVKMLDLGNLYVLAVSITPDGQMAIFADYISGAIHSCWLGEDGNLTFKETQLVRPFFPTNIAISPDGKTLLVPIASKSVLPVFSIDSQHNLCFKEFIPLPSRGSQSCVFSKDGTKAYLLLNDNPGGGTMVSVLNISGPGQVSASGNTIMVEPTRRAGQLFGVDTMALDPSDNYLYVTDPSGGGLAGVSVLDLTTYTQVNFLDIKGGPTGIAFTTIHKKNT